MENNSINNNEPSQFLLENINPGHEWTFMFVHRGYREGPSYILIKHRSTLLTPEEEERKLPHSKEPVARLKKTATPYAGIQEALKRLNISYKANKNHHLQCEEEVGILEQLAKTF